MSWREAPGTQGGVEQRDVEPGGHLAECEQYPKSESVVGHLLLVERDSSCFGSNQTSSLHCDDRDQVCCLGVLEGLSRVANWVSSHTRDSLERCDTFIIWAPSARGPGALIPCRCIEQSDIDLPMFDRVPTQSRKSICWLSHANIRIAISCSILLQATGWIYCESIIIDFITIIQRRKRRFDALESPDG